MCIFAMNKEQKSTLFQLFFRQFQFVIGKKKKQNDERRVSCEHKNAATVTNKKKKEEMKADLFY